MSLYKVSLELDLASPSCRRVVYDIIADSKDDAAKLALDKVAKDVQILDSKIELVTK